MKQETLEEAAERLYPEDIMWGMDLNEDTKNAFIQGAKWQQEQDKNKYSDEEVKEIVNYIMIQANETEFGSLRKFIDLQFEQFKKA